MVDVAVTFSSQKMVQPSLGSRNIGAKAAAASTQGTRKRTLETLEFCNTFQSDLPADPDTTNRVREVTGAAFTRVSPTPEGDPTLICFSSECAELIGLDEDECLRPEFTVRP